HLPGPSRPGPGPGGTAARRRPSKHSDVTERPSDPPDVDDVPPPDPLDERASAVVDGEASPGEDTRSTDPQLAERVATFRHVAAQVGAPVPPPPAAHTAAAIAAALAAGAPAGATDELARRRRRRARRV